MVPAKTTTKIVYNACYGGFSLSKVAVEKILERKGLPCYPKRIMSDLYVYYLEPWEHVKEGSTAERNLKSFSDREISRHDPDLIHVVEELGDDANGKCAKLRMEEVTVGTLYRIDEYDGYESVVCQYDDVWQVAE
jgi:hypothetical protein